MSTYTNAIQGTPSFLAFDWCSSGASEAALRIPHAYREVVAKFIGSATGNQQIAQPRQSIYEIYLRCRHPNWNGAGADRISDDAMLMADRLLPTLPSYLPVPHIYADPTGAIAFEWYRRPRHRFTLSVYGNGTIEFAGLLGTGNEVYGAAHHSAGLPKIISDHLRQLFAD